MRLRQRGSGCDLDFSLDYVMHGQPCSAEWWYGLRQTADTNGVAWQLGLRITWRRFLADRQNGSFFTPAIQAMVREIPESDVEMAELVGS